MEREAVIYFYMEQEHSPQRKPAKKHWWQRYETLSVLSLPQDMPVGEEHVRLYACPVPCYFYKKKRWQSAQLDEAMENAFSQVEGMTDTILSWDVEQLLEEEMRRKWQPREDTLKELTALRLARDVRRRAAKENIPGNHSVCLEKYHAREIDYPASAVIFLGTPQDEDWQLQMAWELLQPYLPKLNRCVVRRSLSLAKAGLGERDGVYAKDDSCGEGIAAFAQDCYYEYGLVVQTDNDGAAHKPLRTIGAQTDTCCLHLDFREDNLYHSAVKYLDTIVKNSYYE
jgi:hypothetical protein